MFGPGGSRSFWTFFWSLFVAFLPFALDALMVDRVIFELTYLMWPLFWALYGV